MCKPVCAGRPTYSYVSFLVYAGIFPKYCFVGYLWKAVINGIWYVCKCLWRVIRLSMDMYVHVDAHNIHTSVHAHVHSCACACVHRYLRASVPIRIRAHVCAHIHCRWTLHASIACLHCTHCIDTFHAYIACLQCTHTYAYISHAYIGKLKSCVPCFTWLQLLLANTCMLILVSSTINFIQFL